MLGPWINSAALLAGGGLGAALSQRVPKRVRDALPLSCGIISAAVGAVMMNKAHTIPAISLALLTGALIGELLFLERRLEQAIGWLQQKAQRFIPTESNDLGANSFVLKYVTILVLFCVSGMGIFGAMHEGMSGNANILLTKSVLDLFTAAIFATELGFSVVLIAVPQILIQSALFFSGALLIPLISPTMQADFSACGGIIMLATGLRICGIKIFPIVNMLPALLLVMPFSALWLYCLG
ncbi:DUF554 domain-containing protein [Uliginosibacterium sp. 31-16]|uniref:DUF554 domain-containing protein n=1 Tax=Uliginosibacterium sp. 31-16 TaxID=3068315 RepID=UPI00273D829F|nr:DUF554 domain-containing protein [Uliginosibacterium sp. 31-16]MDP5239655.1 DUF554 domain-containing protein [Uliginosibacterium sp. 31-16]